MNIEVSHIVVLLLAVLALRYVRLSWRAYNRKLSVRIARGKVDKACELCRHWNLQLGQRAIADNPAFHEASQYVSPNKHSRSVAQVEGEDDVAPPEDRELLPVLEDSWARFGGCTLLNEGRHAIDVCPKFELPPEDDQ